jgi:DnaJ-class molecular chaperone
MDEQLETVCCECNGTGTIESRYNGTSNCEKCGGSGFVTTEKGARILDLMRHNFKVMLQDAVH